MPLDKDNITSEEVQKRIEGLLDDAEAELDADWCVAPGVWAAWLRARDGALLSVVGCGLRTAGREDIPANGSTHVPVSEKKPRRPTDGEDLSPLAAAVAYVAAQSALREHESLAAARVGESVGDFLLGPSSLPEGLEEVQDEFVSAYHEALRAAETSSEGPEPEGAEGSRLSSHEALRAAETSSEGPEPEGAEGSRLSSFDARERDSIIGSLVSVQSKIHPHEEGYGFGVVAIAVPVFGLPVFFLTLLTSPEISAANGIAVWLLSGAVITVFVHERGKAPSAARFREELEKSSDARLADLYCGYLHPDGNPGLWKAADRVRRGLT